MFGLLLLSAGSSGAMSLGGLQGAALIGRPLDISVQAMLDPAEDPVGLCLEADVFYADNKLGKSWVQLTAEKARQAGQGFTVHIRVSLAVNEPVVMLHLRAGCRQKTERRYVLLADLASDLGNIQSLPLLPTAVPGSPGSGANVSKPGLRAGSGPVTPAFLSDSGRTRVSANAGRGLPAEVSKPSAIVDPLQLKAGRSLLRQSHRAKDFKEETKNKARLQLEPLDLAVDREPFLKASGELSSVPASSPEARSAAAALWRALTAQPEDILRDAEKLRSLEASVQSLQAQAQKNKVLVDDLSSRVTQARSERYANGLVYLLGSLLLPALIAVAYLMRRRIALQNVAYDNLPWWKKSGAQEKGWSNSALDAGASWDGKDPLVGRAPNVTPPGRELDLDVNRPAGRGTQHIAGRSSIDSGLLLSRDRPDFAPSMTPSRAVKAEELFDVQQQADFFVSLGQHGQAIEVLRNHIDENVQTSALVYLDLFDLYHQLKRHEDYEALRKEFNDRFNSKIPAFAFYDEKSLGLEAYQAALSRIEALWPSRKVLEVIEESIFRQPNAEEEAFDLEAYRELLILYAVAREIINPETIGNAETLKFHLSGGVHGDDSRVAKFVSTSVQPLSASIASVPLRKQHERGPGAMLPPVSPRLALDIDLSQPATDRDNLPSGTGSDSRFFAKFATHTPENPSLSAHKAESVGASDSTVEPGNLIDFDLLNFSVEGPNRTIPPKV